MKERTLRGTREICCDFIKLKLLSTGRTVKVVYRPHQFKAQSLEWAFLKLVNRSPLVHLVTSARCEAGAGCNDER